jgi:hypothetical protein
MLWFRSTVSCKTGQHQDIKGVHVCSKNLKLFCFIDLVRRYNECMATVRRLPAVEHNFQLVITKVYEDGDQDLLEDEDESEIRDLSRTCMILTFM